MFDSVVQCAVLGIKPKSSHTRDKWSPIDRYFQPCVNSYCIQCSEQVTLLSPVYNPGKRFMQDIMCCVIRYQSLDLHRSLSDSWRLDIYSGGCRTHGSCSSIQLLFYSLHIKLLSNASSWYSSASESPAPAPWQWTILTEQVATGPKKEPNNL